MAVDVSYSGKFKNMDSGIASYFYIDVSGQTLTIDSGSYFVGANYTISTSTLKTWSNSANVTSDKIFGSGFSLYLVYDSKDGWFAISEFNLSLVVYYF